jgi:alkylhydroperoxidase family enzyme
MRIHQTKVILQKYFSEAELVDLTVAIVAINGYNRINLEDFCLGS